MMNVKPVNFNVGEYVNKGYEFLRNNLGDVLVGFLVAMIMSIIPFCGFLAIGNLYKYIDKLKKGQNAKPGEIFNFDNFMPYFIIQLIMFGALMAIYIPIGIIFGLSNIISGEDGPSFAPFLIIPLMAILMILFIIVAVKAFYIPALISLKGVKDIKTAWSISKEMTRENFWSIILFSIIVSILSQIGILACGIGILVTMPFMYTAHYFAFEDALSQIESDDITNIGAIETN